MPRWSTRLEAAALAAALFAPAIVRAEVPLAGTWLTPSQSARIAIAACAHDATLLCGRIDWLARPVGADGAPASDRRNPDAALRSRPLLGVEIIRGLRPASGGAWRGGTIYDPDSGRSYDA